jgi:hypothetical protein
MLGQPWLMQHSQETTLILLRLSLDLWMNKVPLTRVP